VLTDLRIKNLKPRARPYKVADRDGLYVTITPAGALSFRYDYRIHDRRETLTVGRYDESRGRDVSRTLDQLDYGSGLSLAEARLLLTRARRSVEMGESPAKAKAEKRNRLSFNEPGVAEAKPVIETLKNLGELVSSTLTAFKPCLT
jgi:hypothetical protein